MAAILDDPEIRARVVPLSVEAYHQLFEMGEVMPNAELIRGTVVEKMPKTPLHSAIIALLYRHFLAHLPAGWHPRAEQPLTFTDSEPEPDIAIVKGAEADYFRVHPTTAALVIEVCVTSERLDRIKLAIYAEAGVPECWLFLAEERIFERHSEPRGAEGYGRIERLAAPADLESTVFPALRLPPPAVWPA